MAQLVKYRTVSGTAPRIPIQDVVLNMSRVISVDTDVRTGRGVLVYQNDVEISTIYTSEVASYTKSKMTGYVTALMVKYDVFEGEKDQYFVVDQIVYAIRHPSDPYNKTDIYVLDGTDALVNKVTIMASLETLLADANQVSFNGATWGQIGGNIGDQLDLQSQFSTKVDKTTTITINSVTYDLSANRSWTISGAVWGSITGTISDQTDLQSALDTKVPTARTLTINGTTYDLSANRSWTIASGIAIGDTIGGGIAGSVLFLGASGVLAQSTRITYSDTDGLIINPSGTIVSGFTAGLNIKGTSPTLRVTGGNNGFGTFITGGYLYFARTINNWTSYSSFGSKSLSDNYWGFGGNVNALAIVHAKANTATDIVSIFQGTTSQTGNLTEWQNVSGTALSVVNASGYLGIGTTTPGGLLTVYSTGGVNKGINLTATSGSSYAPIDFNTDAGLAGQFLATGSAFTNGGALPNQTFLANYLTTGGVHLMASGASGYIEFSTGGSATTNERMRIIANGNVGIGTSSPGAKLHTKALTATDTVIIAQGTTSQTGNLFEARNVGGSVVLSIDVNGNTVTSNGAFVGRGRFDYINTQNNFYSCFQFINANGNTVVYQNLLFSGTTSSFPAIKRNGTQIDIRLADDSNYAGLNAATLGIGTSTPTSFADIAASTTTRASLRLRSGTLPTVPNAGDISYDGAFKGWNGSTWLTFGGGGGGISIGDTITGASTNSVFFYNGGLAQAAGFTYTTGTSTLAAVNTVFTSIQATNPSNLNIKDYTGAVRLTISIDGTYFLGVGQVATNTSFGFYALRVATGGADNNTAFGYYALAATTGSAAQYNSAFGTSALASNTTGYSNNAFGRLALGLNTTGLNNVAMGHTALYSNTTGIGNVGVGLDANRKGTTANYNIAIGTSAMYGGTTPTGGSNVAIGYSALENYTTGQWNSAIGSLAGTGITTGSYNIFIGTQGSTGITTGSYNTIVGKATGLSSSLSNTIIVADGQGNKGFEWTTPRFTIYGDTLNINTAKTPASSGAAGTTGDIVWDNGFVYVCVATNTWKRAAIITF